MAEFPSLCPVSRSYTAPSFATKRFTSISGAGTTRLYGNKGFDAQLDLQFLVDEPTLISVMASWEESYGTYLPVVMPDSVVSGSGELLDAIVPGYLEWHWAENPKVESLNPDLYRVSTRFIAQLEINS
jgi:hypothetical protein